MSVGIYQHKLAAVVVATEGFLIFLGGQKIAPGHIVDGLLAARYQVPLATLDAQALGIILQYGHAVVYNIHRMRKNKHALIVEVFFINPQQL